jgi:hypothetical protein
VRASNFRFADHASTGLSASGRHSLRRCRGITALFYDLLKPAGRSVSLLSAFLGLAGCIIKTFSRLFYIAPLFVLGGSHYLIAFNQEQLQALSLLFLNVNDRGAGMALAFFGLYAVLTGYLIIRSTFLPRFLGVLSVIAGVGWLAFFYPRLGYPLFFYIAPSGLLGAAALILWLLVFGVNEQRWKERARVAVECRAIRKLTIVRPSSVCIQGHRLEFWRERRDSNPRPPA